MFRVLQEKRQGVLVLWDDVFTPPVIHTGTDTRVSLETNKQTNMEALIRRWRTGWIYIPGRS